MTTRLFERIARLARADAHGVLGALEDRTLLLEQHLREAERALSERRARSEALAAEEAKLGRALEAEQAESARLDEDAELAIAGGKDELARFALRRLLASRRRAEALAAERTRAAGERARLGAKLAAGEQELAELRERARLRRSQDALHAACPSARGDGAAGITDEEVELELLRRRGAAGGVA